jgi:hypothetical protein
VTRSTTTRSPFFWLHHLHRRGHQDRPDICLVQPTGRLEMLLLGTFCQRRRTGLAGCTATSISRGSTRKAIVTDKSTTKTQFHAKVLSLICPVAPSQDFQKAKRSV